MTTRDLVRRLARFAEALRTNDITVVLKDEIDGADALTRIDLLDRDEVQTALRIALKIDPTDRAMFDALFEAWWAGEEIPPQPKPFEPDQIADPRHLKHQWKPGHPVAVPAGPEEDESKIGDTPGYSSDALLRKKPFDQWTERDLPAMERLVRRFAKRLVTRRSRRLVPAPSKGKVDLRRSFRRAVGTGGEFLTLAKRDRAIRKPDLVLICDTSGSMDPYTRFLLAFVLSLRTVVRTCEIFAFNTRLTRLTPLIRPGRVRQTLEQLSVSVPDWSGGTRIGASLEEFLERHNVLPLSVVVILSDGLDLGESEVLAEAMKTIRNRARKVIWLNPLLGDSRYEPSARGMQVALPHVDHFASAHDLESLEKLIPHLAV